MKVLFLFMASISHSPIFAHFQSNIVTVDKFDKIIISPHIEATLVAGDQESVTIEHASLSLDKINIKVEGKTLRIYLDDAKMITKSRKTDDTNWSEKKSIYQGTMARVNISYKELQSLSIRGEENIQCLSPIAQEEFNLKIYGESKVTLKSLLLDALNVTIYGEAELQINDGAVAQQSYTAYGESKVRALQMKNSQTKIRAYGESDFKLNVSEHLKVTAFGEAHITYQGSPSVERGIVIGEAIIKKSELSL